MLEPYGDAIYQQELPFPQGQNDVFAPEMLVQSYVTILSLLKLLSFPPITNLIAQQELPPLEGLNQFLLPQLFIQIVIDLLTANITQIFSPDAYCDSTGATVPSRARSHICAGKVRSGCHNSFSRC